MVRSTPGLFNQKQEPQTQYVGDKIKECNNNRPQLVAR